MNSSVDRVELVARLSKANNALGSALRVHVPHKTGMFVEHAAVLEYQKAATALIESLTSGDSVLGWRDIATAPKDGTPLLLFARAKAATASAPVIGWFIDGDWIECCFTPNHPVGIVPSHWMPRPSFPGTQPVDTNEAPLPCTCEQPDIRVAGGACANCLRYPSNEAPLLDEVERVALIVGDKLGGHPGLGEVYRRNGDVRWQQSLEIARAALEAIRNPSVEGMSR